MSILNEIIADDVTVRKALDNIFELADNNASNSDIKRYVSRLLNIPYGIVSDSELSKKEWDKLNRNLMHKHLSTTHNSECTVTQC